MSYSTDDLFVDIQNHINNQDDTSDSKILSRDFMHKLKVLQFIFYSCESMKNYWNDIDSLRKEVLRSLEENEQLFGYTFFLSLNKNFDYNWNYLRKQMYEYADFISYACIFISYVVEDIIAIIDFSRKNNKYHFVFNEVLDIEIINGASPSINAIINWNNFSELNNVKGGYYLSAKIGSITVLATHREYNASLNKFLCQITELETSNC